MSRFLAIMSSISYRSSRNSPSVKHANLKMLFIVGTNRQNHVETCFIALQTGNPHRHGRLYGYHRIRESEGSLSISTESAGQPNRVEGRIFAPVAPNGFNTANYFIDLSAFIHAGSNDITEFHDDAGRITVWGDKSKVQIILA